MKTLKHSTHESREHQALYRLLERSYFDRVWIKQEAILANETKSSVVAGEKSISLDIFRKAIHCWTLIGSDTTSPNAARNRDRLTRAATVCQRTYIDEPNLMVGTRVSTCRDERDKVYGNLGIMSLSGHADLANAIEIDYSEANTVEDTYKHFFEQYLKRYNTLRLLMDSGLSSSQDMRPTWVPDWRQEQRDKLDLSMESATSHIVAAEYKYHGENILEVLGKSAMTISDVRILDSSNSARVDERAWYSEVARLMKDKLQSGHINEGIEHLSRAIAAYLYNAGTSIEVYQRYYPLFRTYLKSLHQAISNGELDIEHHIPLPRPQMNEGTAVALEQCIRWFKIIGAPLIFSEDGYIGVGPTGSQRGDEVYAILGSRSLMILRPSTGEGSHHVVGPCFIHGLNWGESLLGPLPEGCAVIPRFQPSRGSYVPHYVNTRTGTESMWDPRIEWQELEAHPPMVNFMPVPAPPGEPFRIRPDSEYLKRHGIGLEKLRLE